MRKVIQYSIFIFSISLAILGCRRDIITTDSNDKLTFSTDTVHFDTVFATVGSSTKSFIVSNPHNKAIKISSIKMKNGSTSFFRLNVDGLSGLSHSDVVIPANDYIYVFVEVTIDPQNTNTPYVVEEQIEFETNGNLQAVNLLAWGQKAIFHRPPAGYSAFAIGNEIWKSDTPHVVYGVAVVDSGYKLTISAGAKVFFHGGSTLYVNKHATLEIQGNQSQIVELQGDRLDPEYEEIPGQWNGIYLSPLSKDNKIIYALIKNATTGIQADTVNGSNPTLELRNSNIRNMSKIGLFARGAKIKVYNSTISNCGTHCVALTIGGDYLFQHCDIIDNWQSGYGQRKTSALIINNWFQATSLAYIPRDLVQAQFDNCIIYGNLEGELTLSKNDGALFNYEFNHCIIKNDESKTPTTGIEFISCKINQDPKFVNDAGDYHLNDNSPAIDAGDGAVVSANLLRLAFDQEGKSRSTSTPEIGALEK